MSRILKRPMFRTGGSTNEGIMHGLVNRKNYNLGTRIGEAPETAQSSPLATALGVGLAGADIYSRLFARKS